MTTENNVTWLKPPPRQPAPMRLLAEIAFGGDSRYRRPDPDGAAEVLRRAGLEAHRVPASHPTLRKLLKRGGGNHPRDAFLEVIVDGPPGSLDDFHRLPDVAQKAISTIMHQINDLVDGFGGSCHTIGPINADYVPFSAFAEANSKNISDNELEVYLADDKENAHIWGTRKQRLQYLARIEPEQRADLERAYLARASAGTLGLSRRAADDV
jgi:hypothetical protein